MTVRIFFKPEYTLVNLCKTCGCAPCQVLALNKVTKEEDLHNKEIIVPISTAAFVVKSGTISS